MLLRFVVIPSVLVISLVSFGFAVPAAATCPTPPCPDAGPPKTEPPPGPSATSAGAIPTAGKSTCPTPPCGAPIQPRPSSSGAPSDSSRAKSTCPTPPCDKP